MSGGPEIFSRPLVCRTCRRWLGDLAWSPHDGRVELIAVGISAEGEGARAARIDDTRGVRWWDASPGGWTELENTTRFKYKCAGRHQRGAKTVSMDTLTEKYHQCVRRGESEILL